MKPTPPRPETLRKYGLTEADWYALLARQGGVCVVCEKLPSSGRFNVDHDHVPGWKKMPDHLRKLHVRGLLCFFCNKYYVGRCVTAAKSRNVTKYLENHERNMACLKPTESTSARRSSRKRSGKSKS